MKTSKLFLAVLLTFLCLNVSAQRDWTPLAEAIVKNAGIQPGEVVVVNAGQHTVPLMEAIVMASNIKGAFTTVFFYYGRNRTLARARCILCALTCNTHLFW